VGRHNDDDEDSEEEREQLRRQVSHTALQLSSISPQPAPGLGCTSAPLQSTEAVGMLLQISLALLVGAIRFAGAASPPPLDTLTAELQWSFLLLSCICL
jgi:hypothetical protein